MGNVVGLGDAFLSLLHFFSFKCQSFQLFMYQFRFLEVF